MRVQMEMPGVAGCEARQCAYNLDSKCHARAITVGDSVNPNCDTFFQIGQHVKNKDLQAGVGACKVSDCRYNDDLECSADAIRVGMNRGAIVCETYDPR